MKPPRTALLALMPLVTAASLRVAGAGEAAAAASRATGPLFGTVRNASGAAVAGASLSLATAQGTIVASARCDARGGFRLEGLPPGSYLLRVTAPGFAPRRVAVQLEPSSGAE